MKNTKTWTFILYPESCTEDWKLGLEASKKGFMISPLHNRDTDKDGNLKKAHWHIVIHDPRYMSYSTASKISARIGGVRPESVYCEKGMKEYMTHNGHDDKFQYDEADIVYGNGLTAESFEDDDHEDETLNLFLYIASKGYTEYSDLIDDLIGDEEKRPMLECAINKAYAVQTYLRSVWCKQKDDQGCAVNDKKTKKEKEAK